jgi:hypothetical protein
MAPRIMRDSTHLADIPAAGLDIVAVYANGRYATTEARVRARFPHIPIAWIDIDGTRPDADILDVETGDATPAGAVLWVKAKRLRQLTATHPLYPPILYCNRATLTPLFNAMAGAHLHVVQDFRLWIATLDGTKRVADMTGVTAVQSRGEAQTGGHYDESDVYDAAWLAPPPPPPGPHRHVTKGGETWAGIAAGRNTTAQHLLDQSATAYTPADVAALAKVKLPAGVPYYTTR